MSLESMRGRAGGGWRMGDLSILWQLFFWWVRWIVYSWVYLSLVDIQKLLTVRLYCFLIDSKSNEKILADNVSFENEGEIKLSSKEMTG